jgi:hypothetical protein
MGVGRLNGVGVVGTAVLALGVGVPAGSKSRPRRCDTVGDADAEDMGVEVAVLRGIIAGFGIDVPTGVVVCTGDIVVDGAGDGDDVIEVVPPSATGGFPLVGATALENFFGGAFGGGVASDFIFSRVLLASS